MDFLTALWLPILLSAVATFVLSFLIWAVFPWHKKVWRPFPNEAALESAWGSMPSGMYMFPHMACDAKPTDEQKARWQRGPIGVMTFQSRPRSMPACMASSFVLYLVIGVTIAYIASLAYPAETFPAGGTAAEVFPPVPYLRIFQVCGAIAFAAHAFGGIANGIWFGKPVSQIVWEVIDALLIALVVAGIFAWLWPARG